MRLDAIIAVMPTGHSIHSPITEHMISQPEADLFRLPAKLDHAASDLHLSPTDHDIAHVCWKHPVIARHPLSEITSGGGWRCQGFRSPHRTSGSVRDQRLGTRTA